jgi:hypothetical protein
MANKFNKAIHHTWDNSGVFTSHRAAYMHTSSELLPEKQVLPKDNAEEYLAGTNDSHRHMDNHSYGINICPWERSFLFKEK